MLGIYIVDLKNFVIKWEDHLPNDDSKNQQHEYQIGEHHFEVSSIDDQIVLQLSLISCSFHLSLLSRFDLFLNFPKLHHLLICATRYVSGA
jgi:hypothetical protein